jgi:putative MATE family efflux protein
MRVTSEDIQNGPIAPVLVRMTMPMVIAIFMMVMFQTVDTYFVSMLGTDQLAAISFTFPVTFTVISLTIGLGVATSVLLAKYIGQGELDRARRITTDSILFTTALVMCVSLLGYLTIDPLFSSLGANDKILLYIHEYMDIWYIFVGLMIIPMTGNAAIRATGDTKWPSIMMILSGFLNAGLDPLFIFGYGPVPAMGVKGAAIATVVSWMVGFAISIWILYVREKLITLEMPDIPELIQYWKQLFLMGMPISMANMLTPLSAGIMTALIAPYGEEAVAGFGAGGRIEALFLVVSFALTAALSPYMAQNLGARKFDRAKQALSLSIKFSFLFQLAIYPVIYFSAPFIARIFSDDANVIEITILYLRIMPVGICFYGVLIVYNTAFNAAHQSKKTLYVSLCRVFLCYTPMAWVGGLVLDITGLFIGAVVGNGVAALIGWYVVKKTYKDIDSHDTFKLVPGSEDQDEELVRAEL